VFIERGHKNEYTHYGSILEACTFIVNQDQTFEAGFQMKQIMYEAKWNSKVDWISDEEINRDV
jgi:hypothetical protein